MPSPQSKIVHVTDYAIYPIPGFAEPFSSLSHLIGALVFASLTFFLVRRGRGHGASIVSLSVFAFSSVFLLSMSGVYHLLMPGGTARAVLMRLDHAAIFVLIAGTFTPVHIILFRDWWRWGMLGLIWIAAITALVLKAVFFSGFPDALGVALYVGLGWLGAVPGIALWRRFGFGFIRPLLWGALAYTIGPVVGAIYKPVLIPGVIGAHELFHIAVLMGLGFHWYFIHRLADSVWVSGTSHQCPMVAASQAGRLA
jgi:channel protein (hemolysin III family)